MARHAGQFFGVAAHPPGAQLGRRVYAVPDAIPSRTASLIEPFTVGFRAACRAQPRRGEKAVVFGAGTVGIAAAIGLTYFSCEQVLVCNRSALRLEKAKNLGFAVCNVAQQDVQRTAMDCFGAAPSRFGPTADAAIYIDAVGVDSILEQYQSIGRIGSRMVVVAVRAGKRPVDVLEMTYSRHALIGSDGFFPGDVRGVLVAMESGRWDIGAIITYEFPWERLPGAVEQAARVDGALNAVIRY